MNTNQNDLRDGATPSTTPGTYVVLYRLTEPATGLPVGRLGTFDFPAGHYAYIGSAFGSGGVKARTGRHLTPDTAKRWNIDHLKPLAEPAEVWWTHDPVKRECRWAGLVGGLPGATVPARMFGARDCKKCAAHLYRFPELPAFGAFAREVSTSVENHAPVYRQDLTVAPDLPSGTKRQTPLDAPYRLGREVRAALDEELFRVALRRESVWNPIWQMSAEIRTAARRRVVARAADERGLPRAEVRAALALADRVNFLRLTGEADAAAALAAGAGRSAGRAASSDGTKTLGGIV